MTDHTPMQLEKYYSCYIETEITYTLQPRFCKVDYRLVNVECPNSTQDNTILMMILEAVISSGIDKHPDRTDPCNKSYIYVCTKKNCRDLIYLKFVATDFFPKIISPSAGENSGDLA